MKKESRIESKYREKERKGVGQKERHKQHKITYFVCVFIYSGSYWRKHLSWLISSEIPYNYYLFWERGFCSFLQADVLVQVNMPIQKTLSDSKHSCSHWDLIEFIRFSMLLVFRITDSRPFISAHSKCNHTFNSSVFLFRFVLFCLIKEIHNERIGPNKKCSQILQCVSSGRIKM